MKLISTIRFSLISITFAVAFPLSGQTMPANDFKLAQNFTYESAPTVAPPVVNYPTTSPSVAPIPPSPQAGITFNCISSGSGFATVVSNGVKQAPLITWNSNYFGAEYTPQVRCQSVSQKFQQAVNKNGGKLSNLILTAGTVNNLTVICAANKGQVGCNDSNMLFTLRPENAKNPAAVLNSIMEVGQRGSGSVVLETEGLPEVDLDRVVNQVLQAAPAYNPQVIPPSPQNNSYPNGSSGTPVF